MPRKSAAALLTPRVDGRQARLAPPAGLSPAARGLWLQITASVAPGHFRASDEMLLVAYCTACVQERQAAAALDREGQIVNGRPSPWLTAQEKAVRAMTSLSLRLRLCPHARSDPKTVGRGKESAGVPRIDWGRDDD